MNIFFEETQSYQVSTVQGSSVQTVEGFVLLINAGKQDIS